MENLILKNLKNHKVDTLGSSKIESPLLGHSQLGPGLLEAAAWDFFVDDESYILFDPCVNGLQKAINNGQEIPCFEEAGPKKEIYFDPSKVRAAILTAGGLCPGINNVIRSLVMTLYYRYGVRNIFGIKYGFQGLASEFAHELVSLTPEKVNMIHQFGGTILGSSRGSYEVEDLVDNLERSNFNMLFCVGGDGTLRGANALTEEIKKRKLKIVVVGVPKTIDNDIDLVGKSFGFETAVEEASHAISSAHTEAIGSPYGIGLVKLMGRDSGFIAATAALARGEVNYVFIPEVDFDLDGPKGLLAHLEKRLAARNHAVIVVAEGAGQKFFNEKIKKDASGNILHNDIGLYLSERINKHFKEKNLELNLKYIDPSYIIRSTPANSNDQIYCAFLAQTAVHSAMSGRTNILIGLVNDHFVNVPIPLAIKKRKKVEPTGTLWSSVLESTGQPNLAN